MTRENSDRLDDHLVAVEAELAPMVRAAAARQELRAEFIDELDERLARYMAVDANRGATASLVLSWTGATLTGKWRLRAAAAGLAAALVIGSAAVLFQHFTPEADASALVAAVENAAGSVPAGYTLHVITTYRITPQVGGLTARTIEQWFGDINGRPVLHRIGLQGETMIVDGSGTTWTFGPGSTHVVSVPPSASHFAPTAFNRATLDNIAPGGAQSRVLGHTTFSGRQVTRLELTSTLPYPHVSAPSAQGGVADPSPIPVIAVGNSSGFLFSTTSQSGGGTLTSELLVDDATHEILQGHSESLDQGGKVVGAADWSITTHELIPLSAAPANLFVFIPPAGAQVVERKPGEPALINDHP